jgi:hypothetical protein
MWEGVMNCLQEGYRELGTVGHGGVELEGTPEVVEARSRPVMEMQ